MKATAHRAAVACGFAGLLAAVLASCESAGPVARQILPGTDRVPFFVTPKEMRDETAYPEGLSRQRMIWQDDTFLWEITFPHGQYAYAGLQFRYRTDISRIIDHGDLIFTVTPASAASELIVALIDGTNRPPAILVSHAVRATAAPTREAQCTVRIPLRELPAEGIPLDLSDTAGPSAPFDATDLREVRFIAPAGLRAGQVVIGHLRIEH